MVIWGASGHARVVADIVRLRGEYEIAGFLDDQSPQRRGEPFCGATVLGGSEQLAGLAGAGVTHAILALGEGRSRLRLAALLRAQGFVLSIAIHPRAVIAGDVAVGEGTVVAAGAVVNPGARLGENVIVNTGATVDHDCEIEEGAHICPGAHLAGGVRVGCGAWVGIGAAVIQGVRIGAEAVVGAGAAVLQDVPERVVAYGVPARVVRNITSVDQ